MDETTTATNKIEVVANNGWRKEYPLQKPIVFIGSGPEDDIALDQAHGSGIGPRHLQLIAVPDVGYRLVNLSESEVFAGEREIEPHVAVDLAQGEFIRLGEFTIRFQGEVWAAVGGGSTRQQGQSEHINLKLFAPHTEIVPHRQLEGILRVTNQGEAAGAQFDLELSGLETDFYELEPGPILSSMATKDVSFRIYHRGDRPLSGDHRIMIRAVAPRAYPGEQATVSFVVRILPFYQHELRLTSAEGVAVSPPPPVESERSIESSPAKEIPPPSPEPLSEAEWAAFDEPEEKSEPIRLSQPPPETVEEEATKPDLPEEWSAAWESEPETQPEQKAEPEAEIDKDADEDEEEWGTAWESESETQPEQKAEPEAEIDKDTDEEEDEWGVAWETETSEPLRLSQPSESEPEPEPEPADDSPAETWVSEEPAPPVQPEPEPEPEPADDWAAETWVSEEPAPPVEPEPEPEPEPADDSPAETWVSDEEPAPPFQPEPQPEETPAPVEPTEDWDAIWITPPAPAAEPEPQPEPEPEKIEQEPAYKPDMKPWQAAALGTAVGVAFQHRKTLAAPAETPPEPDRPTPPPVQSRPEEVVLEPPDRLEASPPPKPAPREEPPPQVAAPPPPPETAEPEPPGLWSKVRNWWGGLPFVAKTPPEPQPQAEAEALPVIEPSPPEPEPQAEAEATPVIEPPPPEPEPQAEAEPMPVIEPPPPPEPSAEAEPIPVIEPSPPPEPEPEAKTETEEPAESDDWAWGWEAEPAPPVVEPAPPPEPEPEAEAETEEPAESDDWAWGWEAEPAPPVIEPAPPPEPAGTEEETEEAEWWDAEDPTTWWAEPDPLPADEADQAEEVTEPAEETTAVWWSEGENQPDTTEEEEPDSASTRSDDWWNPQF